MPSDKFSTVSSKHRSTLSSGTGMQFLGSLGCNKFSIVTSLSQQNVLLLYIYRHKSSRSDPSIKKYMFPSTFTDFNAMSQDFNQILISSLAFITLYDASMYELTFLLNFFNSSCRFSLTIMKLPQNTSLNEVYP